MTAHVIRNSDSWSSLFYPKRRMYVKLEEQCGVDNQNDGSYDGSIPSSPYAVYLYGGYASGTLDCWDPLLGFYQEILWIWHFEWENTAPGAYPYTEVHNVESIRLR